MADNKFKYEDFNYGDFTYKGEVYKDKGYKASSEVNKAKDALNTQLAQKPGAYQSQWQTQLNDTIDKILNREKFSYDLNGDALYQQYKDNFTQQGKMASADVIGQASAMTGGYGNSYAATVGNQAYQASLQNLNDVIPELYQMAYDRYNQEGQDLYNQYAMLGEQENLDYGKYRDTVSDFYTNRDYYANRYDSERNFDYSKYADDRDFKYNQYIDDRNYQYNKYSDDRNFAYGKYSDDKSYAYNDYRNAIEDAQWKKQFDETVRQNNLAYKMWKKEFDASQAKASAPNTTPNPNPTTKGITTSQYNDFYAYIDDGDKEGAKTYLDRLLDQGVSEDEVMALYQKYVYTAPMPTTKQERYSPSRLATMEKRMGH